MEPRPFQLDCLRKLRKYNSRGLLCLDMGLGKTPITLWHILEVRRAPAVVVCPASVKLQWRSLARRFGLSTVVLNGTKPAKVPQRSIVIINYDIVAYWQKHLRTLRPELLVLDEIHYVANWCKRTKACLELARSVPAVIGLSGTPMLNKTTELFNGLHMIRPDVFDSRRMFELTYARWHQTPWGRKYAGSKNIKKLNQLMLDTCMIRKRKEDVLNELPSKVRQVVPMELSETDQAEYEEADNHFREWLERQNEEKSLHQVVNELSKVGHLLRLASRLKMDSVVKWLQDLLYFEDKVVVFANHRFVLTTLQEKLKVPIVKIDGSVTGRKRAEAVEEFVRGKARVLVGNLRAAGIGIDGLQRASSNVVFVELPWTPGLVVQGEDRLWRMGAKSKVFVYYLVAYGTIEQKLCKILQNRQHDVSAALDGNEFESQLNILDELRLRIEVKEKHS